MKAAAALVTPALLLAGCAPGSVYETPGRAQSAWTNAFASAGCEQSLDGLAQRVARRPQFAGAPGLSALTETRPGTVERQQYLDVVSIRFLDQAIESGVVAVSEDGRRASLRVGRCAA